MTSLDSTSQLLSIGGQTFNLANYDASDPITFVAPIMNIVLQEDVSGSPVTVSTYYNSSSKTYKVPEKSGNTIVQQDNLKEIIQQVSKESATRLHDAIDNGNDDYMKYLTLYSYVVKVLTRVYVMLVIDNAACGLGKNKIENDKASVNNEIDKLRGYLKDTTKLLFQMESIPSYNKEQDPRAINLRMPIQSHRISNANSTNVNKQSKPNSANVQIGGAPLWKELNFADLQLSLTALTIGKIEDFCNAFVLYEGNGTTKTVTIQMFKDKVFDYNKLGIVSTDSDIAVTEIKERIKTALTALSHEDMEKLMNKFVDQLDAEDITTVKDNYLKAVKFLVYMRRNLILCYIGVVVATSSLVCAIKDPKDNEPLEKKQQTLQELRKLLKQTTSILLNIEALSIEESTGFGLEAEFQRQASIPPAANGSTNSGKISGTEPLPPLKSMNSADEAFLFGRRGIPDAEPVIFTPGQEPNANGSTNPGKGNWPRLMDNVK